ncbi:hydroxyphenylacetyl-CoA thioesterase PaaI (plasmid) [Azospirillum humicireducens]|uniref:Hydroxyphenylacetyl-CoA thioesterase PaaI n=1 Tax=Azospirillum humicireducens TaxID=1226968 RepID=A0A2R4VVU2_9PROT|nr:hydroxyphenylacetyl-CoA thioesterase PaaI [Azospirillum humicireducens]AWB08578.1 hydroxyphenylacetyl-CoA thioesterase PaaI [Azospirillum humicireducens]
MTTAPDTPQSLAEAVGRGMYERDHCAQAHGIELLEIAPGYARMSMTVRKDMVNGHDIGHGGMTFTLADTAFAYACNAANEVTVAAGCSITFPAPAKLGDLLTAECREVHKRGRSGVYDVTVTTQDGTVVGLFRGQSARLAGSVIPVPGASHA